MNTADDVRNAVDSLMMKPKDLMHACIAYVQPELYTFDTFIALHSNNALVIRPSSNPLTKTLLSLPPEILLHIRADLQSAVTAHIAAKTSAALADYESRLVASLCEECIMYNEDVFGKDVWAWVESGGAGGCACRTYNGDVRSCDNQTEMLNVRTRRKWLEAYLSQTYLGGQQLWTVTVPSVLSSLQCGLIVQTQHRQSQYQTGPPIDVDNHAKTRMALQDATRPRSTVMPAKRSITPFGDRIVISPLASVKGEQRVIALNKALRELCISESDNDEDEKHGCADARDVSLASASRCESTLRSVTTGSALESTLGLKLLRLCKPAHDRTRNLLLNDIAMTLYPFMHVLSTPPAVILLIACYFMYRLAGAAGSIG